MNQNNNNFMDTRTIWAIFLVGIVWFGWQQYINKKYGSPSERAQQQAGVSTDGESMGQPQDLTAGKQSDEADSTQKREYSKGVESQRIEKPESLIPFNNPLMRVQVSSKGMAIKDVHLTSFKDRDGGNIRFIGGQTGFFSTDINGKLVDFDLKQIDTHLFLGEAIVNGFRVSKSLRFSEGYRVDIETLVETEEGVLPLIGVGLEDALKKLEKGNIFAPPADTQEIFVLSPDEEKELNIAHETEMVVAQVKNALLASINGHYFSAAYLDKSEIRPNFSINQNPNGPFLKGHLSYQAGLDRRSFAVSGVGFIGPKDLRVLEEVDPLLVRMVKFGFFSAIAKPLLFTMKWFNSVVDNWGLSIILLTFLVRMIVMPLHIMSFRSMKAMQKVQPFIKDLREKYKDDPMTLNRETMDLMKRHKVNPMGGCLPMLLQIPVFFALYRVFSESIELYQAPFVFWITDLSIKDPYFVLPVLMGLVMFLQQKMTPSTMDPAQAKVMQFMPILFSLMMVSLPSALTLYMFVSTFFGVLQQYLFLRDKPILESK